MEYEYEEGITLQDLSKILFERWWVIVISFIICLTASIIYSYRYTEDYYVAYSSMIVQVIDNDSSNYANLLIGESLVGTYSEIASSDTAILTLKENLDLDLPVSTIKSMISVNGITDTLVVELSVRSNEPLLAASIANELILIVQDISNNFEGLESVEILDTAPTPTSPAGPNRTLNVIIGALLGIIIGCAFIFVVEAFDRNIKTEKDIEQNLKLRVLGVIPDYIKEDGEFKWYKIIKL